MAENTEISDTLDPEIQKLAQIFRMPEGTTEQEVREELAKFTISVNAVKLGLSHDATVEEVAEAQARKTKDQIDLIKILPLREITYEKKNIIEIDLSYNNVDRARQNVPLASPLYTIAQVRTALLNSNGDGLVSLALRLDVSTALSARYFATSFPGIQVTQEPRPSIGDIYATAIGERGLAQISPIPEKFLRYNDPEDDDLRNIESVSPIVDFPTLETAPIRSLGADDFGPVREWGVADLTPLGDVVPTLPPDLAAFKARFARAFQKGTIERVPLEEDFILKHPKEREIYESYTIIKEFRLPDDTDPLGR